MNTGTAIHITGIVQGVGFRPWVWRIAEELGLNGTVRNDFDGVHVELFGDAAPFLEALHVNPPPLSRIDTVRTQAIPFRDTGGFHILESRDSGDALQSVSPDIALCEDCRRELMDPENHRFRYPFINCVNCGPRYSIIKRLPYDRPNTSMQVFVMCPECAAEYQNPADRRYHAQPIACPVCGPRMEPANWEQTWLRAMEGGEIVAVKGIGGFHLACDARNDSAVIALRARKGREKKPFAIMVPDLEWVREVCHLSGDEARLLESRERPIVLLRVRHRFPVLDLLAPGLDTLGVMLPYSPLHELMFDLFPYPVVMTSANYTSEPMIHDNAVALERLKGIADHFLLHDRDIINRCDDPVCAVYDGETIVLRPGRGIAPASRPIESERCILSFGADMKNTFALSHHGMLTLYPYIGDLEHPDAQQMLETSVVQTLSFLHLKPELIVHDLHPDYFSCHIARRFAELHGVRTLAVQHHHAHLVGAFPGSAIGFAFDGTGYGCDDTIWGGEVMFYDASGFRREFYLRPFALPGGEAAIKHPARILEALLYQACPERMNPSPTLAILKAGINCPITSSMGRLFDAVSCLLGICDKPTFDGEAAMKLEAAADPEESGCFEFKVGDAQIDWRPMIMELMKQLEKGTNVPVLAARFHNTVAGMVSFCGRLLAERHGRIPWVLSGGVFQNRLLVERIRQVVGKDFELVISATPNDSGLSVGQTLIGAATWA